MTIRYVITHRTIDNPACARQLATPQQGRHTYATVEGAENAIEAIMNDNSIDNLRGIFNLPLAVRAVECWPHHFDPKTCWFD